MTKEEIEGVEEYRKAGHIAKEVKEYARETVKSEVPLIEIAEKIEDKIVRLGGKPAFPVNLSINEIAAHYTPGHNDKTKASGLLKVDLGVHISGFIIDTAFSLDLENNNENKTLILASEKALQKAIEVTKQGIEIWKIGQAIQETITSFNFSPIRNLSGHELGKYKVHAGLTIPNYNNNNKTRLGSGVYAIEPFSTTGSGLVNESKSSGIYILQEKKPIRNLLARKILAFIEEKYKTLPFCERWLVKEFGTKSLLALNFLEKERILYNYPVLVEKSHGKVSQAEHTVLIAKNKIKVLT